MHNKKTFELFGYQLGLVTFIRLSTVLRLSHYVIYMHPKYLLRVLLIITSSIIATPLHLLEWWIYRKKIENIEIKKPPIFIIGHWRSGTTHLHNLMCLDAAFGYLKMYQAIVPDCSIIGGNWLKRWLGMALPTKRPMDNMVWNMETPQEEEVALCRMMPHSFYTQFIFPKKALELFDKNVMLNGTSDKVRQEIKKKYLKLLKVISLSADGKQLILKNPVNTARIPMLLALFPDAKFIHIHRSPYEVFTSTKNLHGKLLSITTLQDLSGRASDEIVLSLYKKLMHKYFEDKAMIPKKNLVEVRYQNLESDPVGEIEKIYKAFALEGFDSVQSKIESYMASQTNYKKNNFVADLKEVSRVEDEWGFSYDKLGYPRKN